jgi:hypothetical protein
MKTPVFIFRSPFLDFNLFLCGLMNCVSVYQSFFLSELISINVPNEPEFFKQPYLYPIDIKLFPIQAVACRSRISVMIIVPALTERDRCDQAIIP